MSGGRFTLSEKNAILAAYEAGEKIETIAIRFGCSPTYPGHLATARGLARRRCFAKRVRLTIAQQREIAARWAAGESGGALAARFGCDPSYPGVLARRRGKFRPVQAEAS